MTLTTITPYNVIAFITRRFIAACHGSYFSYQMTGSTEFCSLTCRLHESFYFCRINNPHSFY